MLTFRLNTEVERHLRAPAFRQIVAVIELVEEILGLPLAERTGYKTG